MEQNEDDIRSQPEVIIHTVILALASVLGLAGNSLVRIAFYKNRRLRTITNFYVLSLALSDIIVAAFAYPFSSVSSALGKWPFDYNFCQFAGFLIQYWSQLSLCTLAIASLNRYFRVVKSDRYSTLFTRKKAISSIVAVWVVFFVQNMISIFATPVIFQWSPKSLYCRGTFLDERTERISYVFFGCVFIIPMLLVIFCYGSIYGVVRRHNAEVVPSLQEPNNQGTITAQEVKTSRIIFAAVLGFCICWTPLIVAFLLEFGFQISIPASQQSIYPLLSSVSVWINPLIYGVMNRAMRREFANILVCRKLN